MNNQAKSFLLGILGLMLLEACVYHDLDDPEIIDYTDETLFDEAQAGPFTYYRNGDFIPPATQSAHSTFRLKFNSVAQGALDANGELPKEGRFPDGSLVVKEVYNNSTLSILSVMKKQSSDIHAREGWVWAEYHPDGRAAVSIQENGTYCVNCHGQSPQRDLVRTFDLH